MRIKPDNFLPGNRTLYRIADHFVWVAIAAVVGVLTYGALYL